jgi:hypothetical protein
LFSRVGGWFTEMASHRPIENGPLVVTGGQVQRVGRRADVRVPDGAVRVDPTGKTVIPGLIDAHSHIGYMCDLIERLYVSYRHPIAEESWHPASGEKMDVIGPLLVASDKAYTARYMEAVFPPGSQPVGGPGHRHPGPEAWYVLGGSQCLETPNGVIRRVPVGPRWFRRAGPWPGRMPARRRGRPILIGSRAASVPHE